MKKLLASIAVKKVIGLVMDKKEGGKEEYKFSPLKSAIIGLVAALAAVLYDGGYISEGTMDCSTVIAEDVVKHVESAR